MAFTTCLAAGQRQCYLLLTESLHSISCRFWTQRSQLFYMVSHNTDLPGFRAQTGRPVWLISIPSPLDRAMLALLGLSSCHSSVHCTCFHANLLSHVAYLDMSHRDMMRQHLQSLSCRWHVILWSVSPYYLLTVSPYYLPFLRVS